MRIRFAAVVSLCLFCVLTLPVSATEHELSGLASWYGKKFHGRKTSSGEIYDMYGVSAAHKTLPLGTYVRVRNLKNHAQISLHPEPVWIIKVDAGAAKLDFDLSPYKIDKLDVDNGASSTKIRLGDKYKNTNLMINSGAAATVIEVPQSSACEVLTNTVLTSKSLDGFDKLENGVYRTDNFNTSENKIVIEVDAAISSLKVIRY